MQKHIILASASPRRKDLLNQIGLKFDIKSSDIDESSISYKNPYDLVKKLSLLKAKFVAKSNKNSIIISADTVVVFKNKIIGKPKDKRDAKKILKTLSSKMHTVITGFIILDTQTSEIVSDFEESKVWFRKISEEEIDSYVNSGEPLDKAGGYGIQEKGGIFVKKIEGDYFNVVGLPLSKVASGLKKLGISVI